jgi:DNA-binding response OmpR family regulator
MISEPLLYRMKILVVDDDRITVTLLEQLLQRHGYSRVTGVTDSREVLETCAAFDPDLILLDLIMPEMDGFALLEALRSDASESFLPIVVLTADVSEEAKSRALEAGAMDFLVKPVSQTEALWRIRNLLEVRRLHALLENQRSALEEAVRERPRSCGRQLPSFRQLINDCRIRQVLATSNLARRTLAEYLSHFGRSMLKGSASPSCASQSRSSFCGSAKLCARRGSNPQPFAPETNAMLGRTIAVADLLPRRLITATPNHALQPTAPWRDNLGVFATDPARGLSLSR